jgi:RAD51-like protein 2
VPALGDAWGAAASTRVVLFWEGSQRWAHLAKSSSRGPAQIAFEVCQDGVRDAAGAAAS